MERAQEQLVLEEFSQGQAYASAYDATSSAGYFFRVRMRRIRELLSGCSGRVLDVGCGPGKMIGVLLERGFECVGVDLSPSMIEECRRRFGHRPDARWAIGDVEHLALPDASFDVVLCMGVLEYVSAPAALREVTRVLKPHGTLIASMLNGLSPYRMWERSVYQPAARLLAAARHGVTRSHPHLQTYPEGTFTRLLSEHGLQAADVVYFDFNLFVPPLDRTRPDWSARLSALLEPLGRGPLRRLGTGFLVKARKR